MNIPAPFTVLVSSEGNVSKSFRYDAHGRLQKSVNSMPYSGAFALAAAENLDAFEYTLGQLQPFDCLIFGFPKGDWQPGDVVKMTTQGNPQPDAIPRDKEHFEFRDGPGILFLDYDPPEDGVAMSRDGLVEAVHRIAPEFGPVELLWRPSVSSCISTADGQEVIGVGGQRLYCIVENAKLIPGIMESLKARAWLHGFGRFDVSSSGSLLERGLVDACTGQPERIDFAGGADLPEGLVQNLACIRYGPKDGRLRGLAGLTGAEMEAVQKARAAARTNPETLRLVRERKGASIERMVERLVSRENIEKPEARRMAEDAHSSDGGTLGPDFPLQGADGRGFFVRDILSKPGEWNGRRLHDPLEPDYRGDARVAVILVRDKGRPVIFSHAHGGKTYRLIPRKISIAPDSDNAEDDARRIAEMMADTGDYFAFGAQVASVSPAGRIQIYDTELLPTAASRFFVFRRPKAKEGEFAKILMPRNLAAHVARIGHQRLPLLKGLVDHPTITPGGRVVDVPGYDHESGIYYHPGFDAVRPVQNPAPQEIADAAERLWVPWSKFPFADGISVGALWMGLLTVVLRAHLPSCPCVFFTAPTRGTGKTLAARTLGALSTGEDPAITSCPTGPHAEEEWRKMLFAFAREGLPVHIFDNLPTGGFDSSAMAQIITSGTIAGRVLQTSDADNVPVRGLILFTGNNIRPEGDMTRRVLLVRLDADREIPWDRDFDFDPVAVVLSSRPQIVADCITLLRGYVMQGNGWRPPESYGGFEPWDRLVRSAVLWLSANTYLPGACDGLDDPLKRIKESMIEDGVRAGLLDFLSLIPILLDSKPEFTTADLMGAIEDLKTANHVLSQRRMPGVDIPDLNGALADLGVIFRVNEVQMVSREKVVKVLQEARDKWAGGYCLKKAGMTNGRVRWKIIGGPETLSQSSG